MKQELGELWDSVQDFHRRFGIPNTPLPERLGLLMEEVGEHAGELNRGNDTEAVKELIDVLYIAMGSLDMIDPETAKAALRETAAKNNAKTLDNYVFRHGLGKVIRRDKGIDSPS